MLKSEACPRLPNGRYRVELHRAALLGGHRALLLWGAKSELGEEGEARGWLCCSQDGRDWGSYCWFGDRSPCSLSPALAAAPFGLLFASAVAPAWGLGAKKSEQEPAACLPFSLPLFLSFHPSLRITAQEHPKDLGAQLWLADWAGYWAPAWSPKSCQKCHRGVQGPGLAMAIGNAVAFQVLLQQKVFEDLFKYLCNYTYI